MSRRKRRDRRARAVPTRPTVTGGSGVGAPTETPAQPAAEIVQPSRSEMQLIRRALRERWPIDPTKRPAIVEGMVEAALNEAYQPRTRISATRTLAMLDAQNLEQERRDEGIPDIIEQRVIIHLPENFRDREVKP